MADRILTGFMTGMQAGGSAVHLGTAVLLLLILFLFRKDTRSQIRSACLFLGAYFFVAALLRVGIFQLYVPAADVFMSTPFVMIFVGGILVLGGCFFIWAWVDCYRANGCNAAVLSSVEISSRLKGWPQGVLMFLLGGCLGWAMTSWPMGPIMLSINNEMLLPGMLWQGIWALVTHEFAIVLAPAAMAAIIIWLCATKRGQLLLGQYRSGIIVLLAAVPLAVGSGLIAVFLKWLS